MNTSRPSAAIVAIGFPDHASRRLGKALEHLGVRSAFIPAELPFTDIESLITLCLSHETNRVCHLPPSVDIKLLKLLKKNGVSLFPNFNYSELLWNREAVTFFAHRRLKIATRPYYVAQSFDEFMTAADVFGFPCVIEQAANPGLWVLRNRSEVGRCWEKCVRGSTPNMPRLYVEPEINLGSILRLGVLWDTKRYRIFRLGDGYTLTPAEVGIKNYRLQIEAIIQPFVSFLPESGLYEFELVEDTPNSLFLRNIRFGLSTYDLAIVSNDIMMSFAQILSGGFLGRTVSKRPKSNNSDHDPASY